MFSAIEGNVKRHIVGTTDRMDGFDVFCSKLLSKGFAAVAGAMGMTRRSDQSK